MATKSVSQFTSISDVFLESPLTTITPSLASLDIFFDAFAIPLTLRISAEILRVKGIAKASKKMSRDAKEGVIVVSGDSKKTSLIEVNCETDFVAKNDDFLNFVKELSEINNQCSSDKDKLNKSTMAMVDLFNLSLSDEH